MDQQLWIGNKSDEIYHIDGSFVAETSVTSHGSHLSLSSPPSLSTYMYILIHIINIYIYFFIYICIMYIYVYCIYTYIAYKRYTINIRQSVWNKQWIKKEKNGEGRGLFSTFSCL